MIAGATITQAVDQAMAQAAIVQATGTIAQAINQAVVPHTIAHARMKTVTKLWLCKLR